jgi:HD-GYP domain-containing protein (c-di-GMP phosphodiesterase class II)
VGAILNFGPDGLLCVMRNKSDLQDTHPLVIAMTGQAIHSHSTQTTPDEREKLSPEHRWAPLIHQAFRTHKNVIGHPVSIFYFESSYGHHFAMALCAPRPLADVECALLKVFCNRISAAFDNLHIFGLLRATEEATVVALADLAEFRDATTGGHVRRVCRLTNAIASELHASGKFAKTMTPAFMAHVGVGSILHDVGKVATPDAVLLKPARLTAEERAIMERHATVGEEALASAARLIEGVSSLSLGAEIAGGHHEHYDGRGYPRGLRGDAIPLAARIVAIVDVFDALLHSRPYKEAWPYDTVIAYLKERRGTQFDPDVLDALLKFLDTERPDWIVQAGH